MLPARGSPGGAITGRGLKSTRRSGSNRRSPASTPRWWTGCISRRRRIAAALRWLHERLGLDPLALEDVHNGHQRTKLERYEGTASWWSRCPSAGRPPVAGAAQPVPRSALADQLLERATPRSSSRSGRACATAAAAASASAAPTTCFTAWWTRRSTPDSRCSSPCATGRVARGHPDGGARRDAIAALHGLRRKLALMRRLVLPGQEALGHLLRSDDSPLSLRDPQLRARRARPPHAHWRPVGQPL
jgi:magnesium transporter